MNTFLPIIGGARGQRSRAVRYQAKRLPLPVRVWDGGCAVGPWLRTANEAGQALAYWWGQNYFFGLVRSDGSKILTTPVIPDALGGERTGYWGPCEIDEIPTGISPKIT